MEPGLFVAIVLAGAMGGMMIVDGLILAFFVLRWLLPKPMIWVPLFTIWATCLQASPEGFAASIPALMIIQAIARGIEDG